MGLLSRLTASALSAKILHGALAGGAPPGGREEARHAAGMELLRNHPERRWELLPEAWVFRAGGPEDLEDLQPGRAHTAPRPVFRTFPARGADLGTALQSELRTQAGARADARETAASRGQRTAPGGPGQSLDLMSEPLAKVCFGAPERPGEAGRSTVSWSLPGRSPPSSAPASPSAAQLFAAEENERVALAFLAGTRCLRTGYRPVELSQRDNRACGIGGVPGDVLGLLHSAHHLGLAAEACLRTSEEELREGGDDILAAPRGGLPCPSKCDDGSRLSRRRFPSPVYLPNTYADVLQYLSGGEPALVRLEVGEDLQFYRSGPYTRLWGRPMGDLWFLLVGYDLGEEEGRPAASWRLWGPPAVGGGGFMELADAGLSRAAESAADATPFAEVVILSRAEAEGRDWADW